MAMRDKEAKRQKRLVDYVCLVGIDQHVWNDEEDNDDDDEDFAGRTRLPQLLRRFPAQDHPDCKSVKILLQKRKYVGIFYLGIILNIFSMKKKFQSLFRTTLPIFVNLMDVASSVAMLRMSWKRKGSPPPLFSP